MSLSPSRDSEIVLEGSDKGSAVSVSPTAPPERVTATRGFSQRVFASTSPVWIFLVLLVIVGFFTALKPHEFLSTFNVRNMLINGSYFAVMAVGMTFVIIAAGIDLAVGSVLVLSGVVAAKVMSGMAGAQIATAGWGTILVGLLAGIATGLGWGLMQGLIITKARVPAFIVTLGGFGAALGIAQIATGGVDARAIPNHLASTIGNGKVGPVPWLVIIALVVALLGGAVLNLTRFGRYTFAIGSNAEGSRRTGINVDWHLIKIYGLVGLLSGLAGDMSLAHFTTTTLSSHSDDNLTVITAVILGGTSLFGGIGSMFGTIVGVFIPVVLDAGLVIIGVQTFWQGVAVGVVLVLAVYADQLRRRSRARA
jgi:ribose transport system permease protein